MTASSGLLFSAVLGAEPGEWLCVDLGKENDVRAIQVNMADEKLVVDFPGATP